MFRVFNSTVAVHSVNDAWCSSCFGTTLLQGREEHPPPRQGARRRDKAIQGRQRHPAQDHPVQRPAKGALCTEHPVVDGPRTLRRDPFAQTLAVKKRSDLYRIPTRSLDMNNGIS